jgi:hypothetical protein
MSKVVRERFEKLARVRTKTMTLVRYVDERVRILGGELNGLEVLAWEEPNGRELVHMDECGKLHRSPIIGLVKARAADVVNISPEIANRARVTNATDLSQLFRRFEEGGSLPTPDNFWLGVQVPDDCFNHGGEMPLPFWARGVEIVEEQPVLGCFGALGYARPDEAERFAGAGVGGEGWYVPLMCEELGAVDLEAEMREAEAEWRAER